MGVGGNSRQWKGGYASEKLNKRKRRQKKKEGERTGYGCQKKKASKKELRPCYPKGASGRRGERNFCWGNLEEETQRKLAFPLPWKKEIGSFVIYKKRGNLCVDGWVNGTCDVERKKGKKVDQKSWAKKRKERNTKRGQVSKRNFPRGRRLGENKPGDSKQRKPSRASQGKWGPLYIS